MRLLLHDIIPPPFRDYIVRNGRVKFNVPSEFEVDLSIAEEGWDSQFFFVDVRFLFSPAFHSPKGHLFDNLDQKVNAALMNSGLVGCFNLLHGLTLTYKILILFKQAVSLSNGRWLDTLRVDFLRRTLVVQYWRNKPGPKSWIEIGVSKTSLGDLEQNSDTVHSPAVCLRWFRDDMETNTREVVFNVDSLSMGTVLSSVTALHISHLLLSTYAKLRTCRLYAEDGLEVSVNTSAVEPGDCWLDVQLTKTKRLRVTIDPVTGLTLLRGVPPMINRLCTDPSLDRPVAEDLFCRICRLRCSVVREEVESYLIQAGWILVNIQYLRQADVRQFFPPSTSRYVVFSRCKLWHRNWLVAFTSSIDGDNWWIVELRNDRLDISSHSNLGAPGSVAIKSIHHFKGETFGLSQPLSSTYFSRLTETLSVAVQLRANVAWLQSDKKSPSQPTKSEISGSFLLPSINFRFLDIGTPRVLRAAHDLQNNLSLVTGVIRISFHGVEERSSCAIIMAHGCLNGRVRGLHMLKEKPLREISLRADGRHFAICCTAPVGQPIMVPLLTQLQQLHVMITILKSLEEKKMVPLKASLSRVDFDFAQSQGRNELGSLRFNYRLAKCVGNRAPVDAEWNRIASFQLQMEIKLPPLSPHRRVEGTLVDGLNDSQDGLDSTLGLLLATLPLLRALDHMAAGSQKERPQIRARGTSTFHVRYPRLGVVFCLQLRRRGDHLVWILNKLGPHLGQNPVQGSLDGFLAKELYHSHGDGWTGFEGGARAELEKVGNLLADLQGMLENNVKQSGHDALRSGSKGWDEHIASDSSSSKDVITID